MFLKTNPGYPGTPLCNPSARSPHKCRCTWDAVFGNSSSPVKEEGTKIDRIDQETKEWKRTCELLFRLQGLRDGRENGSYFLVFGI